MLKIFREVQKELGEKLETQKLGLRTGIHSGSVTAGVLRGEKARFQLFGDTVNTTARHESSGKPGRIHISKQTAQLIKEAGLKEWIRPRKHKVYAKGKGQLESFWVNTDDDDDETVASNAASLGTSQWLWTSLFG